MWTATGFPVLAGSEKLQCGMVNFYEPILLPVLGVKVLVRTGAAILRGVFAQL